MDDIHQQVSICLGHQVRKEISTHHRKTLTLIRRDFSDYVWLIEEDPLRLGGGLENGAQQVATSSGDVGNDGKLREIVSWQYGGDVAV